VPQTLFLLVAGAVVDRVGPRVVLLATDAVLLAGVGAAAVAAVSLGPSPVLLGGLAVLFGTVTAASYPAAGALPARLVEPDALPRALAWRNAGQQLAGLAGSPLGGPLLALGGLAAALGADAATFLPVLAVTFLLRPRTAPESTRRHLAVEAADGLRAAWDAPALRRVLGLYAVAGGFTLPVETLLVPLLAREQGWSAAAAGVVAGGLPAGMLAGAVAFARLGTLRRTGSGAAAGLAVTAAGVGLLAVPAVPVAIASTALAGLGLAAFIAHAGPAIVASSPPTHLGRVQAVRVLVQSVTLTATTVLLGLLASAGVGVALACVAVALAGGAGLAARHAEPA
jgi:Major Facilitator Superfamily